MLRKLLIAALFAASPLIARAQVQVPADDMSDRQPAATPMDQAEKDEKDRNAPTAKPADNSADPIAYIAPNSKRRFKMYLNDIAGPVSVGYYAGTAGLLTARNSPTEWGAKTDGFAKRFVNVAGKHVIKSSTAYGLDKLLKLDSTFHRSRDRSATARLRNCVFSSVTARNSRGKRVLGIPNIVGGTVSEVVSSTVWYPERYDYIHGLKGGAISVGMSAAFNLFREFVWKR